MCHHHAFNWSAVTATVGILGLLCTVLFALWNIRLRIQETLFKIVNDKARDSNNVWTNEPENERHDNSPHFKVVTELIITHEIVHRALSIFGKWHFGADDYYYLFWKQLSPDVRGWVMNRSKIVAQTVNNKTYTNQIETIHKVFQKHFEPKLNGE